MHKLIYLTGAPATGKSTLTESLKKRMPDTHIFTYSKELLNVVRNTQATITTQDDLRRESCNLITAENVEDVDRRLVELARTVRSRQNMVIDSHPVTIEEFGFRVTPFTKKQLMQLMPDIIVCLYARADVISERIKVDAAGRPRPTLSEINLHIQLQCQVAGTYAFEVGASLYYLDAALPPEVLLDNLLRVAEIGQ